MTVCEVNGIRLHLLDRGNGAPLVLLHGFPLDHSMWQHQIEALAGAWRVIAPDLRGFGRSDATPGVVSMEQHADDLAALLDALQIDTPVVLGGLSMGGYISLQAVARHRRRLRALILCDTKSAADSEEARQTRFKMADLVSRSGTGILAESMPAKLFAPAALGSPADLATRAVILKANPIGVAAAQLGMASRPDTTGLLPGIDLPTLVICGAEDAITPPGEMQLLAQAIPSAEYVEIPGAGHMAPLEQPEAVNQVLKRFLDRLKG